MTNQTDLWFQKWQDGDVDNLPITDNFVHTSPYGVIRGKSAYLEIVNANRDKFLDHRFEIHDILSDENKACVRYSAIQPDFSLEVTEWHFYKDELISEIVAYYNIEGEINEDRKLTGLD